MKNWKTTLLGIIAGTLAILQTTLESYTQGAPVKWLVVALGIVMMALGLVMKDFNVSGNGETATTKAVKTTLLSLVLLTGCGLFTPSIKSPCDGLYCFSVETAGIPGAELWCYQTAALRDAKVVELQRDASKKVIFK